MANGKKIKFVVKTTADKASENVIAAARQQGNDEFPEILGPLSAPVAAEVAEIMGREGERLSGGAEDGIKGPFTCVVMPGRGNVPPPGKVISVYDWSTVDFYEDPRIKSILTAFDAIRRRGEITAYAEYNHFEPSSIGAGIAKCNTQREGGSGTGPFWPFSEERGLKFDRVIIFTHAKPSLGPGRDARDPSSVGPNISGWIIPEVVFNEVGPYLKEAGQLYIICCAQWQSEWDGAATYAGTSFFVTVWPGEGRCADVDEIINMIEGNVSY